VASVGGAGIAAIGLFMGAMEDECRAAQLHAIAKEARSRFDTPGSGS
jgi:hypothetical protein